MNTIAPKITDTLDTWLDYWSHVHVTGIDLGLERVIPVAEKLGVVKPNATVFTVAGTNGKGSTTTTIAAILKAQGYEVGLYQSPHVYRFNERVKLNGIEVNDQSLIEAFVEVDQARRDCQLSLSFFEATTLAAFVIFKQQQCDVWVLEVGLGGRLDVVNVVEPNVAVITNIGLDHTDWLGDTIEKIAFEKAGIIRPNIPVIFAGHQLLPEAIAKKVTEQQAHLFAYGQHYSYMQTDQADSWIFSSSAVSLELPYGSLALENVSAAVAAVLSSPLTVNQTSIASGIIAAKLPGRFEVRKIQGKTVVFDAGHNPHGVEFLLKQLQNYLKFNKNYSEVISIFSMLSDKDVKSVTELLKDAVFKWKIAPLTVPRASSLEQLDQALQGLSVEHYDNIKMAFQSALEEAKNHQLILVCGSFHTLEAVWEYLEECQ